jgi:N-acetyl-anhydromuramyl-L-alanine amidase AmpD
MKIYFSILLVLSGLSCRQDLKIIDKPIVFNEERKQLTLDYLSNRYGLEKEEPTIDPKLIVLHWTVIPTFEKSYEFFKNPLLAVSRSDISSAGQLNVSSQFMVDRDGTIYRLLPETTMARHVIGLNHCAIGIENVGGTKNMPLTNAQVKANVQLVRYLAGKYEIEYLLGHYEYTKFEDHELWLEKDDGYRTEKTDPGTDFMEKVRKATAHLGFKKVPISN